MLKMKLIMKIKLIADENDDADENVAIRSG